MTWEDPIVADVRRIREDLSAKFNFDVSAIFADLRARQAGVGDRLVKLEPGGEAEQGKAPDQLTRSDSERA
jgi:hypothetical protein